MSVYAMCVQVGEARAHYLPSIGHQSLHRDASVAAEDMSGRVPHAQGDDVDKAVISRHPSSKHAIKGTWHNGTGSVIPSSSNGPVQEAMTKAVSPPKRCRDSTDAASDDDSSHHVVVSSGALLHNLTGANHRDSTD